MDYYAKDYKISNPYDPILSNKCNNMNYMRSVNKPVSFGRNETFYLKYNWIYKSLSALEENKEFFAVPNSYLDLGVGKNMLVSIKY